MTKQKSRFMELEGLRGIAAIVVVLFHSLVIFYPSLFYGNNHPFAPLQHTQLEGWLFGTPAAVFMSGAFAVAIFFVLSGFVLSIGFFQTKDATIVQKLAAKRYLRLMLPALASVVLVWLLMVLNLDAGKTNAEVITWAGSSSSLWAFDPSLIETLKQGVITIFTTVLGADHYNPVLWTMLYEFSGSFLIFGTLLLFGGVKRRWIVYMVLVLLLWNTWYLGFITGMILADLYVAQTQLFTSKKAARVGLGALCVGLVMGGYAYVVEAGSFYDVLLRVTILDPAVNMMLVLSIGATFTVYAVLAIPAIKRFLSTRYISMLGKYTYALYLTHLTVLFVVASTAFAWLHPILGFNKAVLLALIMTAPVIAIVAWLFERYIDAPSIRLSGVFARWLQGRRETKKI